MDERRQLLNVTAIVHSFRAAMRDPSASDNGERFRRRALDLLHGAVHEARNAEVRTAIDAAILEVQSTQRSSSEGEG